MNRITEVVKTLIILNVIMFIGFNVLNQEYQRMTYLFTPGHVDAYGYEFQPYQIVSHMFMHGGPMHILFNMMSLFFLGPPVEQAMGPQRFLILYFLSGLAAAGLHLGFAMFGITNPLVPIVGASGAVMGVFAAFGTLFPNTKLMLMFIPFPIKAQHLLIFTVVVSILIGVAESMKVADTGIAHFAHLGGALCGIALSWYWYRRNPNISA